MAHDFDKTLNSLGHLAGLAGPGETETDPPQVRAARALLPGLDGPVLDADNVLRIFAYGSLAWQPASPVDRARPATLHGFRRDFCIADPLYRGTPDQPGLTLGAVPDGMSLPGLVLEIDIRDPQRAADALVALARRENPPGLPAYRFAMMPVTLNDGRTVRALTCVADEQGPWYRGDLALAERAQQIAQASGSHGSNLDYLVRTMVSCAESGQPAHGLDRLLEASLRARLALPPARQEALAHQDSPGTQAALAALAPLVPSPVPGGAGLRR